MQRRSLFRLPSPKPNATPSVLALFTKISGKIHFYDSEGRKWIFPLEVVVEGARVLIQIFCIFFRGKLRHKIHFMDQGSGHHPNPSQTEP
jgi:hypothetical protein